MNKPIKERWIEALRSGNYKQCTGLLTAQGFSKFCCLGVLADLLDCNWKGYNWSTVSTTPRVRELIKGSKVTIPQQKKLAQMNDTGASFAEIADYISANL